MYVSHHVLPVDRQRGVGRQAQRGVQYCAVLGSVDVLAGVHGVATLFESGRPCQVHQQHQRFAGHPVLAVVDVEVADRQCQLGAAGRVLGEELAEVFSGDLIMVAAQRFPGRRRGDVHSMDPSAIRLPKVYIMVV